MTFRGAVTAEITGDVGPIEGLHCYVWDHVSALDDNLLIEDLGRSWSNETADGRLRVVRFDPDEGTLVVALNTVAYNYLETVDVYTSRVPDFLGDGADHSARNATEAVAALTDVAPPDGPLGRDETATVDATVANLRDRDREVFVGFGAVDPEGEVRTNDGTTGRSVALPAAESRTVTIAWDVESDAPTGAYDAYLAVLPEADRDAIDETCDELYDEDAFAVGSPSAVDATVEGVSVAGGVHGPGDVVQTDVTVANAGAAEHTFFVALSAIDPDGAARTNGGTTGWPATLSAGETTTNTVEWVVPRDAVAGSYDVRVAVWRASDPDRLEAPLDERAVENAFHVA